MNDLVQSPRGDQVDGEPYVIGSTNQPGSGPAESQLMRYDTMCRAIDAAYEVDEVKDIRDQAIALEVYARQAKNTEAERKACEIRLRAERRAGELSRQIPHSNPGSRKKDLAGAVPPKSQVLRDAGVSEDQARQWEKLAAVPEPEFEAALADPTTKPTTAGIIRANEESKPNPVSAKALWLWGTLCDFKRDGLLAANPNEILSSMTPKMLDEVHTLAPRVATWLKKIGRLS
jgi:hypothetical protein